MRKGYKGGVGVKGDCKPCSDSVFCFRMVSESICCALTLLCNPQRDRSGSRPLSFGQVAVALDQVTKALDAGKAPQQAQDMAIRVASDAPINPPVLRQGIDNTAESAKIQTKPLSTTVITEE